MYEQIPVDVLERYEGKWIVWDQDDKQVVGSGETLDAAENEAETAGRGHLLRVHHVLPRNAEMAGML